MQDIINKIKNYKNTSIQEFQMLVFGIMISVFFRVGF